MLLPLLFLATGLLAGFVDSVAGGGGLLTVPILLAGGVPAEAVLGTNKLQGTFGSGLASWRYARHPGLIQSPLAWWGVLWTLIGAAIGTFIVTGLSASVLQKTIPFLLAAAALYVLFSPRFTDEDRPPKFRSPAVFLLLGLTLGFYDGFFGPGTGSFWAVGLVSLAGLGLTRATAYTKVMNFTSNLVSLITFLIFGKVLLIPGLTMALGQAAGAYLGSHLALKNGAKLIRPLLATVSLMAAGGLAWKYFH